MNGEISATVEDVKTRTQNPKPRKFEEDGDLQEGHLYTVKDGNLQEIQRDPDDTLKKVRLMDEAIQSATNLQKTLRKHMNGYKPDLTLVCSALIVSAAKQPGAHKSVVEFFLDVTSKIDMEE